MLSPIDRARPNQITNFGSKDRSAPQNLTRPRPEVGERFTSSFGLIEKLQDNPHNTYLQTRLVTELREIRQESTQKLDHLSENGHLEMKQSNDTLASITKNLTLNEWENDVARGYQLFDLSGAKVEGDPLEETPKDLLVPFFRDQAAEALVNGRVEESASILKDLQALERREGTSVADVRRDLKASETDPEAQTKALKRLEASEQTLLTFTGRKYRDPSHGETVDVLWKRSGQLKKRGENERGDLLATAVIALKSASKDNLLNLAALFSEGSSNRKNAIRVALAELPKDFLRDQSNLQPRLGALDVGQHVSDIETLSKNLNTLKETVSLPPEFHKELFGLETHLDAAQQYGQWEIESLTNSHARNLRLTEFRQSQNKTLGTVGAKSISSEKNRELTALFKKQHKTWLPPILAGKALDGSRSLASQVPPEVKDDIQNVLQNLGELGAEVQVDRGWLRAPGLSRWKTLSPQKATSKMWRGKAQFPSPLSVTRDGERLPIRHLGDLRAASAYFSGAEGHSQARQPGLMRALSNLGDKGWTLAGHKGEALEPAKTYVALSNYETHGLILQSRGGETFQVQQGNQIRAIDFLHGSGDPETLHDPSLAPVLKSLLDRGVTLSSTFSGQCNWAGLAVGLGDHSQVMTASHNGKNLASFSEPLSHESLSEIREKLS